MSGSPRMLVAMTLASAIVIGAIVALATGAWWVLAAAVLLHFAATAVVMLFIFNRISQESKPDPVAEARIEDEQRPISVH